MPFSCQNFRNDGAQWSTANSKEDCVSFMPLVYTGFLFALTTSSNPLRDSIFSVRKVTKENLKWARFCKQNETLLCFIHAKWKPLSFAALQIEFVLVNCCKKKKNQKQSKKNKTLQYKGSLFYGIKTQGTNGWKRTFHRQTYLFYSLLPRAIQL